MAWSDDRLDDLARHLDTRFDGVDRRFDMMDRRFDLMDRRFDRVENSMGDLGQLFLRIGGGVIVALVGVIAAVLSTG